MIAKLRILVPDRQYFGGEIIYGVVELKVQAKLKLSGVHLFIVGRNKAHLPHVGHHSSDGSNPSVSEELLFLYHRIDLAGAPWPYVILKQVPAQYIEPGEYKWPFALKLPELIPASLKIGSHGKVNYSLCVYVSNCMIDLKHKIHLKIGGNYYDQDAFSKPSKPIQITSHLRKFTFYSGDIRMEVTIPKRNWFVGETIPIQVAVSNDTKKAVNSIRVGTRTHVVFRAGPLTNTRKFGKYNSKYNTNIPGKTSDVATVEYIVPDVFPTMDPHCGIDDHYNEINDDNNYESIPCFSGPLLVTVINSLKVKLDMPWSSDIKIELRINIMKPHPRLPIALEPIMMPTPKLVTQAVISASSSPLSSSPLSSSSPITEYSSSMPSTSPLSILSRSMPLPVPTRPRGASLSLMSSSPMSVVVPHLSSSASSSSLPPPSSSSLSSSSPSPPSSLTLTPISTPPIKHVPVMDPVYPALGNYQFPTNTRVASLSSGVFEIDAYQRHILFA